MKITDESINELLEELHNVNIEHLEGRARDLFYAIMQIADERDKYIALWENNYKAIKSFTDLSREDLEQFCFNLLHDCEEQCKRTNELEETLKKVEEYIRNHGCLGRAPELDYYKIRQDVLGIINDYALNKKDH